METLIVDVDDTVLDTFERKYAVLQRLMPGKYTREYAESHSLRENGYGKDPGFYRDFFELFDSPEFMHLDRPMSGASGALKRILDSGIMIDYVTGRHEEGEGSMRPITIHTMELHGIPSPDGKDVRLYMKPEKGMDAHIFKEQTCREIMVERNIIGGVGDQPKDAEMYANLGILPFALLLRKRSYSPLEFPLSAIMVTSWKDLEGWIF